MSSPIPSRRQQVLGSKWTLAQDVVDRLRARWPVMVDLFATALNYSLPVYFSSLNDPMIAWTDAFLQEWDSLIRQVINKLCSCKGTLLTLIALFGHRRNGSQSF